MVRFDIHPEKTALLVIDMQNAFLKAGAGAERSRGRELIPRLNRLIDACREKNILVIYTQHMFRPDGSDVGLYRDFLPEAALKSLAASTPHVEMYPEINIREGDIVIPKPVYDAFLWTELDHILRIKGIDTVIIGGLDTLLCCESTARGARHRNYKVIFLSDGTATADQPDMGWGAISADQAQGFVLTIMALRYAEVISVAEAIKRIGGRG